MNTIFQHASARKVIFLTFIVVCTSFLFYNVTRYASATWGDYSWGDKSYDSDHSWGDKSWGDHSWGDKSYDSDHSWGDKSWGDHSWGDKSYDSDHSWGDKSWGDYSWGDKSWGDYSWCDKLDGHHDSYDGWWHKDDSHCGDHSTPEPTPEPTIEPTPEPTTEPTPTSPPSDPLASIGNQVWEDTNGNHMQDAGEPGVAGVTVHLHLDADSNGYADSLLTSTTTDANGMYRFDNLDPNQDYVVQFIAPDGRIIVFRNMGDDTRDNDADANGGYTEGISLAPGEYNDTVDAGLFPAGTTHDDFK